MAIGVRDVPETAGEPDPFAWLRKGRSAGDADDVQVELDVDLPASVARELTRVRRQRDELEAQPAAVLDRQRSLAVRLVEDQGMTYRDAARSLGEA